MPAPAEIHALVERFEANLDSYRGGAYNETLLRRDFLDPMFKALGWDMDNAQGYAEAFRDVVHEDAIKVGGSTKAPDYSFRIGGRRIFFLEAKKPSVFIKEDVAPAYQLRRYAWSADLPLSVLSDFEEFAVYDCRVKPALGDKAAKGRVLYLTFRDYIERWDEIAGIFSKEAVLKGSFDRYAREAKGKRGTTGVDGDFLAQIEGWRETLAKNIALRNNGVGARELNFAVQTTIDRIVFLRICEDRGIEPLDRLRGLTNGTGIYARLSHVFREADDRYNSGLFHFRTERHRAGNPDEFTLGLKIDDKVLKELILGLYYPESPYEFSVLPADILGQVYERFLGSVIRLTAGGQAKIEEKPEVKKAGGVYYTPTYIVDYIVGQTIGRLCEGKAPRDVAKLRVLDPACGSGSFLIGAYQYLLDWHLKWYADNEPERHAKGKDPKVHHAANGWRLTASERKRILTNNIYGVDIDAQAVEVSKLSLLLKVLEGETDETLNAQMRLFHERALPDLDGNIKCGNSLIGPDFFDGQLELDEEERRRINAFDWQAEFAEVFKSGGFDAVIGNPPWGSAISSDEKDYLQSHSVSRRGEAESHLYFIERGISLLRRDGILGFITPNTWLTIKNAEGIRRHLLSTTTFVELSELSKYIFVDAPDIVPSLVFISARPPGRRDKCIAKRANVTKVDQANFDSCMVTDLIPLSTWATDTLSTLNLRATDSAIRVRSKLVQRGIPLGNICSVLYGIKTGDNARYVSKDEAALGYPVKALKTGEIGRYSLSWKQFWLDWGDHLAGFRKSRVDVPKIVIQYIRKLSMQRRLVAAIDVNGSYYPLNNYSYVSSDDPAYSLRYVLGILNSSALNYYFASTFIDYNIKPTYLQQLPIRAIDMSNRLDRASHDRMVAMVNQMLQFHEDLASAKTAHEKTLLERQIAATDRQIDTLVYELYGLTGDEIAIVEGSVNPAL
ncbi:Eco57I restriction-modification methylase domain-containing protein [Sulfuritalea hydrogenivorans]|jgi:hypothetical protein|uniref:site-specific DNA-methyltransferase (adenine-specific) n=1 Tax=Sulfuritalea hydrogenivorans sk43H TaxID=1223802 RepID=W0SHV6_9PROT|nr:N-6 DNA methylase [Sulfuritalea hydrogenivorans]BAO30999.1 eco57IR: type IIS restriction enzyme Eco57I [Sulfuritalea hydrogenivorans sk43H]